MVPHGMAATNNHGNAPAFITIDLCSNGIGDSSGSFGVPRLVPGEFDIGIDVGADARSIAGCRRNRPLGWAVATATLSVIRAGCA